MEFSDALRLIGIEKECVIRNSVGICNRNCGECDLAQEDTDLIEAFQMAEFALRQIIHEEPKMTHADRIRVMTDEKLAAWLEGLVKIAVASGRTTFDQTWLEWLKEEAKENAN